MPPRRHRRTASAVSQQSTDNQQRSSSSSQPVTNNMSNSNAVKPNTSTTFNNAYHQHRAIDMTAQTDGQQMIFDLYPQHSTAGGGINDNGDNNNNNNNNLDLFDPNENQSNKKVFYQQPDGRFTDARGEEANRQQRVAAHHQLEQLRTSVPAWMNDDDAKSFAPFFLYVVFSITHIRRMLAGAAAGFCILILIAIYWAPSLTGVSIDAHTKEIVENATIGGAYETLCLNETSSGGSSSLCATIVAYSAIYRPASYFFIVVSLLCTFGSLVPFVFEVALMSIRVPPTVEELESQRQQQFVQQMQQQQQQQQKQGENNNNNPQYTSIDASHQNGGNRHSGIAQTTGSTPPAAFGANSNMIRNQSPIFAYGNMLVRHLVLSTFPLFFVALITCMATAKVEIDRRLPGQMVSITSEQANSIRDSMIVRSICFILAWIVSFRFRERVPTDEVLNADAVIDLRS